MFMKKSLYDKQYVSSVSYRLDVDWVGELSLWCRPTDISNFTQTKAQGNPIPGNMKSSNKNISLE